MDYNITNDILFNSLPVHFFLKHDKELNNEVGPLNLENLEKDVEIEEKYLEYLFHHKDK